MALASPEAAVAATEPALARPAALGLIGALVSSLVAPGAARADDTLTVRGIYYKERATRVVQPMVDAGVDVGARGRVDGHALLDAITSASAAAGSDDEAFTERRYEVGAGYAHQLLGQRVGPLDTLRLGGRARLSTEPDYQSRFGSVRVDAELAEKNLTLGAGAAYGQDNLSNAGAQGLAPAVSGELRTVLGSASASHLLGPNLVVGATYDVARLRGFQENPYRSVVTLDGLVMERHPDVRTRHAVAASGRGFVPRAGTTWIASYRFYTDSWGVVAHTPELRLVQAAGDTVEAGLRYRYHRQGAADFYQDRYPTSDPVMQPHLTDDEKLSAFTTHTVEAKLAALGEAFGLSGRWGGARLEGVLEYVLQYNRFGNAIVAQLALTVPLEE